MLHLRGTAALSPSRAESLVTRIGSHVPGLRDVEKAFLQWVPLLRRRIAVLARKE